MVADGPAENAQGVAQAGPGRALRVLGPKESGQRLAAVGSVGVHDQVGQQGTYLVGGEAGDGFSIQDDFKGAQESDR